MSRTVPANSFAAMTAGETADVFIQLLTITNGDSPPSTIYVSNNSENVFYDGQTFVNYPFALETPTDEAGNIAEARLAIDNVSRVLLDDLRTFTAPLSITMQVVNVSQSPPELVAEWLDFELRQVSYDVFTISGRLTQENFLSEPYPKDLMTGATYPGQF